MSIQSEITRINGNITNAYTAVSGKGGTLPAVRNSANLPAAIQSIPRGGTLITKTVTQNGTYNASADNADGYSQVTVAVSGGGEVRVESGLFNARLKGCTITVLGGAIYGGCYFKDCQFNIKEGMKVFQEGCYFNFDSPSTADSVLGEYVVPGFRFVWNRSLESSADYPVMIDVLPPLPPDI